MTDFEKKVADIRIKETEAYEKEEETGLEKAPAETRLADISDAGELKRKYGNELYQIDTVVDEDDEQTGRTLRFIFKRPNVASFNRYLKTASKNMAASTTTFTMDNIIEEQRPNFEEEAAKYPGLALGVGTKLLSALGLSDNVNFKKL